MKKEKYSKEIRKKAEEFIRNGKTYREIREELHIPKSTLSTWFSPVIKKPISREEVLQRLAKIRIKALQKLKEKRELKRKKDEIFIQEKTRETLASLEKFTVPICKSLLAVLYWAEGSRSEGVSGTKFVNTDPNLVLLYLALLKKAYHIDQKRLTVGLHLHYYHPIKATKLFWSELLNIPLSQFNKVYLKKRSITKRFRKNFKGICLLYYGDSMIRKELIALGKMLKENV